MTGQAFFVLTVERRYRRVLRLSYALASVLAAGLTLTVAGCSQVTPLGPDAAASLPQPQPLRSPLVVQVMQLGPPASAGLCPAGEVALSGGPNPTTCYRKTATMATITSAAISPVSSFRPPTPPGQPAPPVQYGFWITLPASESAALTAVITVASGPQGPPSSQGSLTSSASTSALTVSVASHTWALAGFGIADAGRRLQIFLSSDSQALQLQGALSPSG